MKLENDGFVNFTQYGGLGDDSGDAWFMIRARCTNLD